MDIEIVGPEMSTIMGRICSEMTKIKVLFISNDGTLCGAAASLIDLIKALLGCVEPYVVMPEHGPLEKRLQELKTEYFVIPFTMGYGTANSHDEDKEENNFRDNYKAALYILSIVRDKKIQIVHSNTSVSNVGAFVSLLANIPHVWHVRELLEHYGAEYWDIKLKKALFSCADKIIGISNCVKQKIYSKYNMQAEVIYDGIDIDRYITDAEASENIRAFGITHQILMAGNICPDKGQESAVMAIGELVDEGIRDIHLTLVGHESVSYLLSLKHYIKEHRLENYIKILPFQMDLRELRKKCGYSLTCSRLEALGRVTLESMLAGNIVIGANTGGTLEIIGAGQERGYLYEEGNYRDLAAALKRAFVSDNEIMRRKAREFVCESFNLEHFSVQMYNTYTAALREYSLSRENENLLVQLKSRYDSFKKNNLTVLAQESTEKYKRICSILDKWLKIRQSGHTLEEYFIQEGLLKIAVYGMGYLGTDLYNELQNQVKILYVIDQRNLEIDHMIKTVRPDEPLEEVDAIIITAQDSTGSIKKLLESKCDYRIMYLDEIVYSYELDNS